MESMIGMGIINMMKGMNSMNKEQEIKLMKIEDDYLEALINDELNKYPKNHFTNKKIKVLTEGSK